MVLSANVGHQQAEANLLRTAGVHFDLALSMASSPSHRLCTLHILAALHQLACTVANKNYEFVIRTNIIANASRGNRRGRFHARTVPGLTELATTREGLGSGSGSSAASEQYLLPHE
jgi:hypothetical protein